MYFSEYMYPLIPVIWHTAATHAATAAAEIAKEICDTKLQAQTVSSGIWLTIRILPLPVPAAAVFELIDQIAVITVRGFHCLSTFGMLERCHLIAKSGMGERTVVIPSGIPVLHAV